MATTKRAAWQGSAGDNGMAVGRATIGEPWILPMLDATVARGARRHGVDPPAGQRLQPQAGHGGGDAGRTGRKQPLT
jgi:hypothetical protein